MALKRNLIANYFGQGWVILMGMAFVPLYIKYLGIETYGLIGLFAVLQAWLNLLDMGMTPTLNREMARFTASTHTAQSIRDLLRSVEIITLGIASLIAAGVWAASGWLATDWLRAEKLSTEVVVQAFTIMGVVTALRFVETIYRSSIVGLQQQMLLSIINATMATLRGLGAVAILAWVSPTIEAFFLLQGLVSILTLATLGATTYRNIPKGERSGRFSIIALRNIWRFAGGMMGITFLALLLTQVDKILLSKLLLLSEYGCYTLATVVAGALSQLIKPITQALYPRLCELHARNDQAGLADTFHKGAQLVSVIAGSAAIVVIVFSETLLHLWTQDPELARRTATLVRPLMLGYLLNGLMWVPYQTQLAHGWTGLAVRINIVSVLIIVPAILWVTPRFGAEGAAWIWVNLNAGYVLIGVHFMYRKILTTEKWRWYIEDILAPLSFALIAALGVKWLTPTTTTAVVQIAELALASIAALSAAAFGARHTRHRLLTHMRPYLNQHSTKTT